MILDYKVPFVPSDKEYEVVFIREGQQVVIPCRGSVENLNVTLQTVRKRVFFLFFFCSLRVISLRNLNSRTSWSNFCRMKGKAADRGFGFRT